MAKQNNLKMIFRMITIITTVLILMFIFYGIKMGLLQDKTVLVNYMKGLGIGAPIFFIFLQAVQVVFPVIPGGASCLAGVLAFGSIMGFIYNYIGLVIGSVMAFYLSRRYGLVLVRKLFSEEIIDKYLTYIKNDKFQFIFFWGIFLPGMPDDLLVFIAGVSSISFKKFLWIILLGKPLALLMYSFFVYLF